VSSSSIEQAVRAYVASVEQFLVLSDADRGEIIADLEQHLREVSAEGEGSLEDRLGPPAAYAAELLASAGLRSEGSGGLVEYLQRNRFVRWARSFVAPYVPGWWLLRGLLVVVIGLELLNVVHVHRPHWTHHFTILVCAWIFIGGVLAVSMSVRLGRAARKHVIASVLSALATVSIAVLATASLINLWGVAYKGRLDSYLLETSTPQPITSAEWSLVQRSVADGVADAISSERFDDVLTVEEPYVRAELSAQKVSVVWSSALRANGAFTYRGPPVRAATPAGDLFDYPMIFQHGRAHLQVSLDSRGRVTGLVLRPGPPTGQFGK